MPELFEYKCPCCGGKVEFDSKSQQMKCPYCDAKFDPEALKSYDDVLTKENIESIEWEENEENLLNDEEADGLNIYICESCGGEVVGDETLASTKCPYCDSPVVIKKQFAGELKPDYVIPFKLDKKDAKKALEKHLKGKKLLPKVFKDQNHIDEIKGVYVPYWLFGCDSNANIYYKASNIQHWSDSQYNYTRTTYYSVYRAGVVGFDNIPVDGSKKLNNDMTESIEPYNFQEAVDFQTAYLSGYLADKYDVSSEESILRANERVKQSTESAFKQTVNGYAVVTTERSNIQTSNGTVKYALLPIWLLNTSWKNEKYYFIMNGQTGKFAGDLPMDWGLFWKWFFAILTIVSLVVYIGATLLAYFNVF